MLSLAVESQVRLPLPVEGASLSTVIQSNRGIVENKLLRETVPFADLHRPAEQVFFIHSDQVDKTYPNRLM